MKYLIGIVLIGLLASCGGTINDFKEYLDERDPKKLNEKLKKKKINWKYESKIDFSRPLPKLPSIFDNLSDSLENRSDSLRKVKNDLYSKGGKVVTEARLQEIFRESSNGISDFEIFKPEIDFNDSIP